MIVVRDVFQAKYGSRRVLPITTNGVTGRGSMHSSWRIAQR
jgi:hypothetical protein